MENQVSVFEMLVMSFVVLFSILFLARIMQPQDSYKIKDKNNHE